MRNELADILPVIICNVCSCYRSRRELGSDEQFNVFLHTCEPQLQVLPADGLVTSSAPRHGHTTLTLWSRKYCLQPTGISGSGENMKMLIVCHVDYHFNSKNYHLRH